MLRKFILINLILVLAWQPVGIAFASTDFMSPVSSDADIQSMHMANCELMDRSECVNFEACGVQGHISCDLKTQLGQSVLSLFNRRAESIPIIQTSATYHSFLSDVLLRPPRIS
ncbi:MAG: hypothetical protein ACI9LO_000733 [Planctomycetota bacterium]|jgi:hypothetical protein